MRGLFVIIKPDGKVTSEPLTASPALEKMQAGVGGNIEVVPYFTSYGGEQCVAFCNEEGKLQGLPFNHPAQKQWEQAYGRHITVDHLVGDIVVIVGDDELLEAL